MHTLIPFSFTPQLIVRTPALPFLPKLLSDNCTDLLSREDFLEAIYLASPVLYKEAIKLKNGSVKDPKEIAKIETSLVKYYQRMYSRCTPFGLFSGCSMVHWSSTENSIIILQNQKERHTRLDMHYLCALSQHLAKIPAIKKELLYYPNNSYYKTADEIRYVEYKYIKGRRVHQISALLDSEYLNDLLVKAKNGITIDQMEKELQKEEVTSEEALEFIEELLEAQILTNELEPSITGEEFMYQIIQTLNRINTNNNAEITAILQTLNDINALIENIDHQKSNTEVSYKKTIACIERLGVAFEEHKLFQTDLVQVAGIATLHQQYQESILACLALFNGLQTTNRNSQLDSFSRRFQERYEEKEMPLLQVMDAETGIGYLENSGKNISPLLDEIMVPIQGNVSENLSWDKTAQWLFNLLKKATAEHLYEVVIDEADIKELKVNWNDLPPSISVLFRIVLEDKILIESYGGSSAANLLARFAHGDKNIQTLIQNITTTEQKMNEDIVFAEIVHLPESRVGNILLHPEFRDYEIPYLAKSSLPVAQQLPLEDLLISVKYGHIQLRSQKLNKLVIPRLSSAHNFSNNALPIYQFLCDLQTQNLRSGFSFYWGSLSGSFRFLPRVSYRGVILSEACWQFNKKEKEDFIKAIKEKDHAFLKALQIPSLLVLADGDNELLLDLENGASINSFADAVKNRNSIVLKEFLAPAGKLVTNEERVPFVNQFIASLVKNQPTYAENPTAPNTPLESIQRSFVPGTEWFYAKLYCGVKSADKILEEFLFPLLKRLQEQKLMDNWFFIRYRDTDFHIRIRLHIPDANNIGTVMEKCGTVFQQVQDLGLVWKVQLDTYQRELERYGGDLCQSAEQLFGIDSAMVMQFLQETEGDERENIRWLWGMKNIDFLLNAFDYSLEQKIQLLDQTRSAFNKEFKFNKFSLQSINKKYATHKKEVDLLFGLSTPQDDSQGIPDTMFVSHQLPLQTIAASIKEQCNARNISSDDLLKSYMHMSLNRLFLSESRLQEAIIYEFLYKWYVSLKHRNK